MDKETCKIQMHKVCSLICLTSNLQGSINDLFNIIFSYLNIYNVFIVACYLRAEILLAFFYGFETQGHYLLIS